ncbi:MAG TPA: carbon-nitrogen hydrolase family protein [Planctomycetaceae bacterium]|nr:carbon-nitrogen hydrolase family protein [Planctomycetaceae bacterium]
MLVAAVQMDVSFAEPDANLRRMQAYLRETASERASLTIFPECAVTGYCFESLAEARPFAEPVPGPATGHMARACREVSAAGDAPQFAVFGMLEADGDRIFNAAVLVGPNGLVGVYRKVHLPFLGVDMHTAHGDRPFAVHEAGGLRVGMNICYDAAFPEAARALALRGADLIALPTNWPPGAECVAGHVINTRAMENAVYYAAVNRVGAERGFTFIGQSRICDPSGRTLAEAAGNETVLFAEVDPARARQKRVVRVPGKHEIDRFADRRPEMYGPLVEPHQLAGPRTRS